MSQDGQELIDAFFAALSLRDFDRCAAMLDQLRALSQNQLAYTPWFAYFDGILANERDNDYAEAERIFRRLLSTDFDPSLRGRVLLALGVTCHYQGHWMDAIRAYESCEPIFARLEQPVNQAKAWKEIAISYRRGFTQSDFGLEALENALAYCQRALDVLESIADPSSSVTWLTGTVWNTLGLIHTGLEQWDEAIACYHKDLAICRSLDKRHSMGLSYGNLGEVYQKRGRETWSQALEAYHEALTIIREFDDRYEEAEALANLGFLYQEMEKYTQALEHYGQAIETIERLRSGISSEAARAGFFATIADTYANTVLLLLETGDHAQAFDVVERARSRAFLDALAARSSELAREAAAPTLSLSQVQAALPDDALLVEYFTTGLVEAKAGSGGPHQCPERHRFPASKTVIFAVTSGDIQVHDAGVSPNDLRPRQLDSVAERHFLSPDIRRALYDRLIAPIELLLKDRRRVYLVPHGPLHYVPFQALVAPDGGTLLRKNGPQFVYAPSTTVLFSGNLEQSSSTHTTCLALGYNSSDATRLAFAEEEAHRVASLANGRALTGPSLKKDILFEEAPDCRFLHISCHGAFDPENPLASSLHLAEGEILTALDVIGHLHLNCDLVTLSACESGLSRVRRGDELEGLVRAFLHAGARALVSTLWRVDERSTLTLMEKFYRQLLAGADPAEALATAQLYLRSQSRFADPFYWAPFILVGRSPLQA